jgi:hypothetical protein
LEDQTEVVLKMLDETEKKIEKIQELVLSFSDVKIGPHCNSPFECPFKLHCFSQAGSEKDSVLSFPHLRHKWDLFNSGKKKIQDLTESDLKTDGQKSALKKFQADKELINYDGIRTALSSWTFPLYFLDFETVDSVYPKYPNTKPNSKITYQFSLFRLDEMNQDAVHVKSYLAQTLDSDPRFDLAKALVGGLKGTGSIVSYNASFERGCIDNLANLIPELRNDLLAIKDRIVDLLPVMKENVFRRDFNWSWSIKSVTPALFGDLASYKHLSVTNGLDAQVLYLKSLKDNTLAQSQGLLIQYCDKDVEEMIRLYKYLIEKLYQMDFGSS